eukprot:CAMPEP_0176424330 /NCGR_PEP_ID=MMETSP0127-20121128/10780_1 /TAXON_ID=938130 /ORGANISM="Platyophrya macrostoma, Strain WH" /LENGTH=245 /DNA_ID=CAMNT_0017805381 /DNA_START=25 /DNA_END=762 /DNA_ORIENTATION=+
MLSKVATRAFKGVLPLLKSTRPAVLSLVQVPVGTFTTEADIQRAKLKLSKSLSKELKYEEENYQVDDSVQNFLKQSGFQLKDAEGENELELRKQVGSTTVLVTFQSRPPNYENEEEEGEKEQKEENQEEQEGESCDFTVYLIRPNKQALCYECATYDSEIIIQSINVIDDVEGHRKLSRFERGVNTYSGPEFGSLDERLQTGLQEYLRGFGINEELAVFIEHVSLDKEHRLYMKWLTDVSKWIEH